LAGQPVLGKTGAIRIPADANDISVSADGVISTKRTVLGQLRLVGFARPELLRPVGDSLLQSDQAPFELGAGQANVVSGVIEKSNVETSREVSRLEEVVRSYEMVGRLLKSSQDVADINKLGNVPD
jgi:flagellar basal-body rod protein FlgF